MDNIPQSQISDNVRGVLRMYPCKRPTTSRTDGCPFSERRTSTEECPHKPAQRPMTSLANARTHPQMVCGYTYDHSSGAAFRTREADRLPSPLPWLARPTGAEWGPHFTATDSIPPPLASIPSIPPRLDLGWPSWFASHPHRPRPFALASLATTTCRPHHPHPSLLLPRLITS